MGFFVRRSTATLWLCLCSSGAVGCELIVPIDRYGSSVDAGNGGESGKGGVGDEGRSGGQDGGGGQRNEGGLGGGGGRESVCGNGAVESREACDDANLAGGDGCSEACALEPGFACSGAPSACAALCGDNLVRGAEACDDGNRIELDGCSNGCTVDTATENEPNDTSATANGPFAPEFLVRGSISRSSDVDLFAITLPGTADLRIETFDGRGPAWCSAVDTELTLFRGDGSTVLATDDDGGLNACSLLAGSALRHLPAGTYFVRIAALSAVPAYSLALTYDALCGDHVTEGGEACDGGPGCSATCDRIPTCGDGFVDAPETCDDSNTAVGDGCDAACRLELHVEREPNDGSVTANGSYLPTALIAGAISPIGDIDLFAITVPATADLKIASFDAVFSPFGPGSCAGIDTALTLYGTDGTTVLVERDQGGVNSCATIDSMTAGDLGARHLPAGTYYVKVQEFLNRSVIPGYRVLITYNALCGNGVVEGVEECDGTPGCSATCDRVPHCGDGFIDAPETCDDRNTASGDGCDVACQSELSRESEPNDTAAAADGPFTPFLLLAGSINPGTDVDFINFTLTSISDVRIETFDGNGPGSCVALDSVATLYGPDGTRQLAREDNGGIGHCSRIDAAVDAGARHLGPGTYFVKIEDFNNNTIIPAYRVSVALTSVCGDGLLAGSEECDGGPGCDASCQRVPRCGDGFVDAPETCDDGNTVSGDGCDAVCRLELTSEVEPNNDPADADARALDATPISIARTTLLRGAIGAVGDHDLFRLALAGESVLRIESFDVTGVDCGAATTLRWLDSGGVELASDENSGISSCSALVLHVAAGVYYVQVEERDNDALNPAYVVEVAVETSLGSEAEPDDTVEAANVVGGTEGFVLGGHSSNSDSDFFAVTVAEGRSIRAEIIEGGAEACESNGIDSALTLYDASGALLGNDDDSGRGFCSRIDGTGVVPEATYASALTAGTYYLQVEAAPFAQGAADPSGQFDYALAITVR